MWVCCAQARSSLPRHRANEIKLKVRAPPLPTLLQLAGLEVEVLRNVEEAVQIKVGGGQCMVSSTYAVANNK